MFWNPFNESERSESTDPGECEVELQLSDASTHTAALPNAERHRGVRVVALVPA
jgi:hypothetical protein